jgi:glycerate-2-kinase
MLVLNAFSEKVSMIIKNADKLASHSNIDGRRVVLDILEAGFEASDPYENAKKLIHVDNEKLLFGHPNFEWQTSDKRSIERTPLVFDLSEIRNIYVAGGGKAAQRMAKAIEDALGDLITEGQINAKKGEPRWCKRINVTFAGHPIPDEDSVEGSKRIVRILRKANHDDLVIYAASGGASALTTLPGPGLTLEDLQEVNRLLFFECGASMQETNAVRTICLTILNTKHLRYAGDATCIYFLTNEVPPNLHRKDPRDPISSGGTDAYQCAIDVLKRYQIWEKVPESVRKYLKKADPSYGPIRPEEVKGKPYYEFTVMDPHYMLDAAKGKAEELGLNAEIGVSSLNNIEVRPVAETIAYVAQEIDSHDRPLKPPCALIFGGELLVAVGKSTGVGGRNQEFALWAASMIDGRRNIVIASADSDGTDGPTYVAGGIVDGHTMGRVREADIDIFRELDNHNSNAVLGKLGDHIITGARGTNVRDLRVVYIGTSSQG